MLSPNYTFVTFLVCVLGVHPEFFIRRVADLDAIYSLCSILKVILIKLCHKYNYNMKLFTTAFIFIQI
jgi:hypothetical protein